MVQLNKIYTKTGDAGSTRLADGSSRPKHDLRVSAYGTVDEANAILGLMALQQLPDDMALELRRIQNDCFDLGSDLATPFGGKWEDKIPRISEAQVERLEAAIDAANEHLEPLTSFILPGGSRAAALCHQARTVIRRAERDAWAAWDAECSDDDPKPFNAQALIYLNRLSDLSFVWARLLNDGGKADVLWEPGANRS